MTESEYREIYRDEYMIVSTHNGQDVGVQVGDPPEEATPTIVNAVDLLDALGDHLHSLEANPDSSDHGSPEN